MACFYIYIKFSFFNKILLIAAMCENKTIGTNTDGKNTNGKIVIATLG